MAVLLLPAAALMASAAHYDELLENGRDFAAVMWWFVAVLLTGVCTALSQGIEARRATD